MAKETRPTKRGRPKSASPVIFKPVYLAVENFTAWRSLRSELGFYSDNELAKELLSTYNEVTSQRRRRNAVKCVQVDETHDATISLCSPCTEKSPVQNSSFNDEYSSSSVGGRQEEEAEIIPLQQSRSSTVRLKRNLEKH